MIRYLISLNKIDITAKNNENETILHKACINNNLELIQYLISLDKLDINAKNDDDKTPLSHAINNGNLSIIIYLTSHTFIKQQNVVKMNLLQIIYFH